LWQSPGLRAESAIILAAATSYRAAIPGVWEGAVPDRNANHL